MKKDYKVLKNYGLFVLLLAILFMPAKSLAQEEIPEGAAYKLEETQLGVSIYYDKNHKELGRPSTSLDHNTVTGWDLQDQLNHNGPNRNPLSENIKGDVVNGVATIERYKYKLTLYEDLYLTGPLLISTDVSIVSADPADPKKITKGTPEDFTIEKYINFNQYTNLYLIDMQGSYQDYAYTLALQDVIVDGKGEINGINVANTGLLDMKNVTLQNFGYPQNMSNESGLAIHAYGDSGGSSTVIGDNVTIRPNYTQNKPAYGGAIATYFHPGGQATPSQEDLDAPPVKVTLTNSTIEGGKASYGGAVYQYGKSDVTFINTTFLNNQALAGGGFYLLPNQNDPRQLPKLTLIDSLVEGNEAKGFRRSYGGAIFLNGDADKGYGFLNLKGTTRIEGNKAQSALGGAVYTVNFSNTNPADESHYQNITIEDTVVFKENMAYAGGEPFYFMPPSNYAAFTNLAFAENTFKGVGNGLAKSLLNNADIVYYGWPYGSISYAFASDTEGMDLPVDENGELIEDFKKLLPLPSLAPAGPTITPDPITVEIPAEGGKWVFDRWEPNPGTVPEKEDLKFIGYWKFKKDFDPNILIPGVVIPIIPEIIQPEFDKPLATGTLIIEPEKTDSNKMETVETKLHKAYIKGYPEGTVKPEGEMTRAEAVAVVVRLQEYPLNNGGATPYTDADGWYNKYINAAYEKGILVEKSGEPFRPDEAITRAELARLIAPIDKTNNTTAPFEDIKGHEFEKAINQAYGPMSILWTQKVELFLSA